MFCLGKLIETGGPRTLQATNLLPHHSLSSTVALWPPLLTNRISYWDCTDEVQGERDCCELAILVVLWVVTARAVLGVGGIESRGYEAEAGR